MDPEVLVGIYPAGVYLDTLQSEVVVRVSVDLLDSKVHRQQHVPPVTGGVIIIKLIIIILYYTCIILETEDE